MRFAKSILSRAFLAAALIIGVASHLMVRTETRRNLEQMTNESHAMAKAIQRLRSDVAELRTARINRGIIAKSTGKDQPPAPTFSVRAGKAVGNPH